MAERLTLRPYQEDTVQSALNPPHGVNRRLVVVATGGGKTLLASEIINRALRPGQRALFLAHREELLIQAKAEIEGFVPGLLVEIEQAQNRATRSHHLFGDYNRHVVVGSVQTLRGKRLESWAPDAFDLIIIDEAHHASATSYMEIVKYFGCFDHRATALIGVTATPNRSDGVGLGAVFQHISAVYGIRELVQLGFLCGIKAINVKSHTDISRIKVSAGDFAAKDLENAVDDDDRNALIVSSYKKFALGRSAVAFTAGVEHALHLADWFRSSGISAEAVYGSMEREERQAALRRYHTGNTQILTNHSLLTEGFNEPKTSCIILARPSKSSLVITQQVGRGTRLFPGKEDCLVIDVKDVTNGKSVVSVPSLAGLPPNFDTQGKDIFSVAKKWEKLDPRLAARTNTASTLDKHLSEVENGISVVEIDLMAATAVDPYVEAHSNFLWTARTDSQYEISPNKGEHTFRITADTLGTWHITVREKDGLDKQLGSSCDLSSAFETADKFIQSAHSNTALIDRGAKWRNDSASMNQISTLEGLIRRGILRDEQVPASITKGQACALISYGFNQRKAR